VVRRKADFFPRLTFKLRRLPISLQKKRRSFLGFTREEGMVSPLFYFPPLVPLHTLAGSFKRDRVKSPPSSRLRIREQRATLSVHSVKAHLFSEEEGSSPIVVSPSPDSQIPSKRKFFLFFFPFHYDGRSRFFSTFCTFLLFEKGIGTPLSYTYCGSFF